MTRSGVELVFADIVLGVLSVIVGIVPVALSHLGVKFSSLCIILDFLILI